MGRPDGGKRTQGLLQGVGGYQAGLWKRENSEPKRPPEFGNKDGNPIHVK